MAPARPGGTRRRAAAVLRRGHDMDLGRRRRRDARPIDLPAHGPAGQGSGLPLGRGPRGDHGPALLLGRRVSPAGRAADGPEGCRARPVPGRRPGPGQPRRACHQIIPLAPPWAHVHLRSGAPCRSEERRGRCRDDRQQPHRECRPGRRRRDDPSPGRARRRTCRGGSGRFDRPRPGLVRCRRPAGRAARLRRDPARLQRDRETGRQRGPRPGALRRRRRGGAERWRGRRRASSLTGASSTRRLPPPGSALTPGRWRRPERRSSWAATATWPAPWS